MAAVILQLPNLKEVIMFKGLLRIKKVLLTILIFGVIAAGFVAYSIFNKKDIACNKESKQISDINNKKLEEERINKNFNNTQIKKYKKDFKKSNNEKTNLDDNNSSSKSDNKYLNDVDDNDNYTSAHCDDDAYNQLQDFSDAFADLASENYANDNSFNGDSENNYYKEAENKEKDNKKTYLKNKEEKSEKNNVIYRKKENNDKEEKKGNKINNNSPVKSDQSKEKLDQLDALIQLQAKAIEEECKSDINRKVREKVAGEL